MRVKKIVQPTYYDAFTCDPQKCKETCCARWQIEIDRETCLNYLNSSHPQIQKIAQEWIEVQSDAISDDEFAKIKMRKDMTCPFLNRDRLCQIVLELGPEALSKTCATFPRAVKQYEEQVERGLVMSCSVACELALRNQAGIELEEKPFEQDLTGLHFQDMTCVSAEAQKDFWKLRAEMIAIMKNRKWDLYERIFRIGALIAPKEMKTIPYGLADDQFYHLNQLLSMKFQEGDSIRFFSERYIDCLMQTLDVFGGLKESEQGAFFQKKERKLVNPMLKRLGYLFENYWVNYIFVFGEDFLLEENRWEAYLRMALLFGLMRLNVVGLAAGQEDLSEESILKLIQSMEKTFVPDQKYYQIALKYLREQKLDDAAGIASLITNHYK